MSTLPDDLRCEMEQSSWSMLSTKLLIRDMKHHTMTSAQIGDAGAVAAIIAPSALTTRDMNVCIELQGKHTRGMTVCDPREFSIAPDLPISQANVSVCIDVDARLIKEVFTSTLFSRRTSDAHSL